MKEKNMLLFRIGTVASVIMAIAASVLYAVSYKSFYDVSIRHFNASAVVTAFVVFAVLTVLLNVGFCFCFRRQKMVEQGANQIESFVLWLCAFMFICYGVLTVASPDVPVYTAEGMSPLAAFSAKAIGPLAILSAVPFVCAVSDKLRGSFVHGAASFVPVIWGVFLLFKYYFDLEEMPLNDPELSVTTICISAIVIFMLSESRSALGVANTPVYWLGSVSAFGIAGGVSTARIVLGIIADHNVPSLMENIIFFSVSALALTRLISFESRLAEDEAGDVITDPGYTDEDADKGVIAYIDEDGTCVYVGEEAENEKTEENE
ncbi:MAG: hypothetical protein IJO81_05485 [Clostridia bacterium]|nr:hypothetical protein [Clostridia bacterium]